MVIRRQVGGGVVLNAIAMLEECGRRYSNVSALEGADGVNRGRQGEVKKSMRRWSDFHLVRSLVPEPERSLNPAPRGLHRVGWRTVAEVYFMHPSGVIDCER
jgi:hypothetical protein